MYLCTYAYKVYRWAEEGEALHASSRAWQGDMLESELSEGDCVTLQLKLWTATARERRLLRHAHVA